MKKQNPEKPARKLALSWSNWGFGIEPLSASAARLEKAGVTWIELVAQTARYFREREAEVLSE